MIINKSLNIWINPLHYWQKRRRMFSNKYLVLRIVWFWYSWLCVPLSVSMTIENVQESYFSCHLFIRNTHPIKHLITSFIHGKIKANRVQSSSKLQSWRKIQGHHSSCGDFCEALSSGYPGNLFKTFFYQNIIDWRWIESWRCSNRSHTSIQVNHGDHGEFLNLRNNILAWFMMKGLDFLPCQQWSMASFIFWQAWFQL